MREFYLGTHSRTSSWPCRSGPAYSNGWNWQ